ncbi:MAG: hypothetical protein FD123_3282 [Bacteroidetes bacterium]|nr:MAG: hypothetical protein FD123_3282 [Bacteroidota bacterium]
MDIEELRTFCLAFPHATEDVKWGHDLCFCIAGKMFCVTGLDAPHGVSFKVTAEEFEELSVRPGWMPAPYVARYKWVLVKDLASESDKTLKKYIKQSYELILAGLPAKERKKLETKK